MTINVHQAKRLYDLGAVFVDVRPVREWSWGHVYGAVHLDLQDGFQGLAQPQWPRQVPLVVYCDSEVCPSGAEAARMAVDWGYVQVFYSAAAISPGNWRTIRRARAKPASSAS